MLGHKLWQHCAPRFDAFATFREEPRAPIFDRERCITGVTAEDVESIRRSVERIRPDAVVNCIGIVKQDPSANDPLRALTVNAMLPHHAAAICESAGARLVHLSTDCVFHGDRGNYAESDIADARDLYGRTKLLGEVTDRGHCLTIRTSVIGRELHDAYGLAEWFFSQAGKRVHGYTRAVFSGLTTNRLSRILGDILEKHPALHGLYHVAAAPIAKYDLLVQLNDAFQCNAVIEPDGSVVIDRSLDGSRFRAATGFQSPSWQEMIEEMHADSTPYDSIRRGHR